MVRRPELHAALHPSPLELTNNKKRRREQDIKADSVKKFCMLADNCLSSESEREWGSDQSTSDDDSDFSVYSDECCDDE